MSLPLFMSNLIIDRVPCLSSRFYTSVEKSLILRNGTWLYFKRKSRGYSTHSPCQPLRAHVLAWCGGDEQLCEAFWAGYSDCSTMPFSPGALLRLQWPEREGSCCFGLKGFFHPNFHQLSWNSISKHHTEISHCYFVFRHKSFNTTFGIPLFLGCFFLHVCCFSEACTFPKCASFLWASPSLYVYLWFCKSLICLNIET